MNYRLDQVGLWASMSEANYPGMLVNRDRHACLTLPRQEIGAVQSAEDEPSTGRASVC